eukprot:TRINITY_DN22783_c1_g1_i1.p1 TRINITY_DN22783_c1_g1~~TRINITY_DN22783_c1_g1_i1.p1  ORF type:complete len:102 (-),score=2.52 TRINITY_DN22783_c1_g1_i1:126-431(-)
MTGLALLVVLNSTSRRQRPHSSFFDDDDDEQNLARRDRLMLISAIRGACSAYVTPHGTSSFDGRVTGEYGISHMINRIPRAVATILGSTITVPFAGNFAAV